MENRVIRVSYYFVLVPQGYVKLVRRYPRFKRTWDRSTFHNDKWFGIAFWIGLRLSLCSCLLFDTLTRFGPRMQAVEDDLDFEKMAYGECFGRLLLVSHDSIRCLYLFTWYVRIFVNSSTYQCQASWNNILEIISLSK